MTRAEATENYLRAQKMGQRDHREKMLAGRSPYLPVLDDILQNEHVETQMPIGLVEVPLDLVVGTKTAGRTAAFSSTFMPLLGQDTEFAAKWISLCMAHVEEGIREPVRVYEYFGRFYVQEGNKRVSVLKFFDAGSISAQVIRVVPQYQDREEIRLYYEFMHAYPLIGTYRLRFTRPGSFAQLQKLMGKGPDEKWTEDERAQILSLYNWVRRAYQARGGRQMRTKSADILLLLLKIYPREELEASSPSELAERLNAVWDDVLAMQNDDPVKVSEAPAAPQEKTGLLERILPGIRPAGPERLRVAFVHDRNPEVSSWTNQHEFGRTQLDRVFEGKVTTTSYFNAVVGENDDALLEQAIAEGAELVFTTSPKLIGAALRAAVRHPQVRILNCSVQMPYASIRTYYTRVYEAKFITGAIAAAMSRSDVIGYVADYPIYGAAANINAFALGARMVNPRVRIDLQWTCLPNADPVARFHERGVSVISGRDAPTPGRSSLEFGTFLVKPGGVLQDLASPFWHWGQFYENVVRTVLDGGWTRDKSGADGRAVNYWWGMNSGVMDVLFSRELPHDVRHLAEILRNGIISGSIDPFACHIVAQDGTLKNEGRRGFEPDAIMQMDWLCDAVIGHIPEYDELDEIARPMYRMQGVHRDRLPAEKGEVL